MITSDNLPGGYNGKIARVDLSKDMWTSVPLDNNICRENLGGAGFISRFLLTELKPGIDPLSPENKLIFAAGPVTGISIPGAGRHCIGAKSPLTGTLAKCEVGEFWGAELKRAGFDALIVEGKAERPVYLWIHDGQIEIKPAGKLWGQNTKETQEAIRNELGDRSIRTSTIGPAGEKLVRFACIMCGLFDAAARGGLGAVMGSKNLKAIAVKGQRTPKVADPAGVKEFRTWSLSNLGSMHALKQYGTGVLMVNGEKSGNLPVRNFNAGLFPDVSKTDAITIKSSIRVGMDGCFACPVRCKKIVKAESHSVDPAYGGPEYETLAAFGSNCGVSNLEAIARANQLCNAYSLDTISTGAVISFSMECFEKGLLTRQDTRIQGVSN